jgi:AcrR family transcriptional regulator
MKTPADTDKRSRLVNAAAKLVYEHGFNNTTLADIAHESGVPLGNVYYYFKTKEAIGEALVHRLGEIFKTARATWDAKPNPKARVEAFIQTTIDASDTIASNGCPLGSLCVELDKDGGPLALRAAKIFEDLLKWLEDQFRLMGQGADSRDLAFHLVSALQGARLLANAFHSTKEVTREAKRLQRWVRSL